MRSSSVSVRGLAAVVFVCALACVGAATAGATQLAVVAVRNSDAVSIVNTATNQVVGSPVEVGDGPAAVAITPDGRYAYVTDAFGDSVSVIDIAKRTAAGPPIEVGETPFGLAISPDGSRAYVADRLSHEVSVIDTQTKQVVGTVLLAAGSRPAGVAVSPDGKFVYVTEAEADAVEVIDTETLKVTGEPIEVGEGPEGLELTPDGKTAYVVDGEGKEVTVIDTSTRQVTSIPLAGERPRGIVISPDGSKAFVVDPGAAVVSVINTATNHVSKVIPVGAEPQEVAITADGKTVYVTEAGTPQVQRINVETGAVVGSPIPIPGEFPAGIALTPDQSPTAVFSPPNVFAGSPATFSGAASTDPDGTVAGWSWAFGDFGTGSGSTVTHTFATPGTYNTELSVVDNEGCGKAEVFTGRTAYCSGNPLAAVVHPVEAKVPPTILCSGKFSLGGVSHNLKNGTARLAVRLPAAGSIFLFGKKVHAVTRKSSKAGTMRLTIHARVRLNKRLKKIHRAQVKVRVTYTPTGTCGSPRTIHTTLALLRAPRKKHHG